MVVNEIVNFDQKRGVAEIFPDQSIAQTASHLIIAFSIWNKKYNCAEN